MAALIFGFGIGVDSQKMIGGLMEVDEHSLIGEASEIV